MGAQSILGSYGFFFRVKFSNERDSVMNNVIKDQTSEIYANPAMSCRKDAVGFDYAADGANLAWFIKLSFRNFPLCDIRLTRLIINLAV